jgi:hypothetical protein
MTGTIPCPLSPLKMRGTQGRRRDKAFYLIPGFKKYNVKFLIVFLKYKAFSKLVESSSCL